MTSPTEVIQGVMEKDPAGLAAMMETLAPIVKSLMDDQADQLEERLSQMGVDILRMVASMYAIKNVMIEKGVCTDQELAEASQKASEEMQNFLKEQHDSHIKEEKEIEIEL